MVSLIQTKYVLFFFLFFELKGTREKELGAHKCRWQLDSRKALLLACGKPCEQKAWASIRLPLKRAPSGEIGQTRLSSLCLCCSTFYIIRISPPSYPTVCTQSKLLPLFFMLGKDLQSFSCYSAPTWYCCVKRDRDYGSIFLTLLAEISGVLSCLTMTGAAIFTAYSHRLIVDLDLQPDQMALQTLKAN